MKAGNVINGSRLLGSCYTQTLKIYKAFSVGGW